MTDSTEQEQLGLDGVDMHPQPGELRFIPTDELPDGNMYPTPELVASIKSVGILEPITVIDKSADTPYQVISGRRKIMAARTIGLPSIPALVFRVEDRDFSQSMTIIANGVRSDNPIADLDAILSLSASGSQHREIAEQLNIPVDVVQRRARLAELPAQLLQGVSELAITLKVAEKASRLTTAQKELCVEKYAETGSLTSKDIAHIVDITTSDGPVQMEMKQAKARKPWKESLTDAIMTARLAGISREAFVATVMSGYDSDIDEDD